jgi:hypothetical protein
MDEQVLQHLVFKYRQLHQSPRQEAVNCSYQLAVNAETSDVPTSVQQGWPRLCKGR